jgi:hypothetical protein
MSMQTQASRAERLRQLFLTLHAIMTAEHEGNWVRGVHHIIAVLEEVEADPAAASDRIAEACQVYRSMNAGSGTFSDFHIWRDNFAERVKANEELNKITEAIWRELEPHA